MYRVSTDITSDYADIMGVNLQKSLGFLAQGLSFPGCWAYPDMLEVGVLPGLHAGEYWLPYNEAQAHFNAWAVTSSLLVLSIDLTNATTVDYVWPIISNWEAIAVNQVWAGSAGGVLSQASTTITWPTCGAYKNCTVSTWQILYKPLPADGAALLLLNHDDSPLAADVTVQWSTVPGLVCTGPTCMVRDINTHTSLGSANASYTFKQGSVQGRDNVFLTVGSAQ
jgi:hypothetical protein